MVPHNVYNLSLVRRYVLQIFMLNMMSNIVDIFFRPKVDTSGMTTIQVWLQTGITVKEDDLKDVSIVLIYSE